MASNGKGTVHLLILFEQLIVFGPAVSELIIEPTVLSQAGSELPLEALDFFFKTFFVANQF